MKYEHFQRIGRATRLLVLLLALYVILFVTFALNSPFVAGLIVLLAIFKVKR